MNVKGMALALSLGLALGDGLVAASRARAGLEFAKPTVDLGEIRTGQPLEHRFTFSNNGRSSVQIVDTQASCGCLVPELDKQVLKPGEKATLLLKVHTLSAPVGRHQWQVKVKYESLGVVHEAVLALHAHVLQEIRVQPPALIIYGERAIDHEITVTDLRTRPLSVRGVETTSPHLTVRHTESSRTVKGDAVHKIKLAVPDTLPAGRHDEQVVIHTDDERYRELRIPVAVIKKPKQRFSASPASVALVASRGQPTPSRLVQIRDPQNQVVAIERVLSDHAAVSCDYAREPQVDQKVAQPVGVVRITVDGRKLAGNELNSQVKVYLKQQVEPLTIPVTCTLR